MGLDLDMWNQKSQRLYLLISKEQDFTTKQILTKKFTIGYRSKISDIGHHHQTNTQGVKVTVSSWSLWQRLVLVIRDGWRRREVR